MYPPAAGGASRRPAGWDPFLRAVEADPESDEPRLAFADWLDEHSNPDRAAFIRVQCEAYPLGLRAADPPGRRVAGGRAAALEAVEAAAERLLRANQAAWTAGLPKRAVKRDEVRAGVPGLLPHYRQAVVRLMIEN